MDQEAIIIKIHENSVCLMKKDFQQFSIIVPFNLLKQVSRHLRIQLYPSSIVHTFLYYIISIETQFKLFRFENACLKRLFQYYLSQQLIINIKDYSILCGFLLGIKVTKCVHLIYLLVYGTFASAPYVQAICNQQEYKERKKTLFKNHTSRKIINNNNIIIQQSVKRIRGNNVEFQNFAKQLRDILRPFKRKKTTMRIKPTSLKLPLQETANIVGSIPMRIQNRQNSSLIKFLSSKNSKSDLRIKKTQKVRFNIMFDETYHNENQKIIQKIVQQQANKNNKQNPKFQEFTKQLKKQNCVLKTVKFGKIYIPQSQTQNINLDQARERARKICKKVTFSQNLTPCDHHQRQSIISEINQEPKIATNVEVSVNCNFHLQQYSIKNSRKSPNHYKLQRDKYVNLNIEKL